MVCVTDGDMHLIPTVDGAEKCSLFTKILFPTLCLNSQQIK
jgi:hypothetical protein